MLKITQHEREFTVNPDRIRGDRILDSKWIHRANDLLQQGEQANDLSQVALSHEEIGGVFTVQEQYPEALGHYDESCKINKELGARFNFGYSVMHRGSVLWQLGRYDEASAACCVWPA